MKKSILALLCAVMLVSLCACSQDSVVQPRTPEESPEISPATETAQAGSGYAFVSLEVPVTWTWEPVSDEQIIGIALSPKDCPELEYTLAYHKNTFGVCGTGLEEKPVSFDGSGLSGSAGYYDGADYWNFISFDNTAGSYAVTWSIDGGAYDEDSIPEYNAQLEAMLETAQLGAEGAVSSEQAVEAQSKAGFTTKYGRFDYVSGWWVFRPDGYDGKRVYADTQLNVIEPDFCTVEGTYENASSAQALVLGHDGSFVFGELAGDFDLFGDIVRLTDSSTGAVLYFERSDAGLAFLAEYSDSCELVDGAVFEQTSIFGLTNSGCR